MNQDIRKVLIISTHIAPMQGIGTIRWTKISKYLSLTGRYEISVLTTEKNFDGHQKNRTLYFRDPLLEKDMVYFDRYFIIPEPRVFRWLDILKNKFLGPQGTNQRVIALPNVHKRSSFSFKRILRRIPSFCKAYLQKKAAERYIDRHPELMDYDVVISCYEPKWPHLAAGKIKKEKPAVVWIADYRDPHYNQSTPKLLQRRYQRFAATKTAAADRITAVSEGMVPLLYLSPEQHADVVPNGFDPSDGKKPERPNAFSLLYTGTLYNDGSRYQDLTPAFTAIRDLIEEGHMKKEDVSLQYAGRMSDLFMTQAAACGLAEYVQDLGRVSREAVIQKQCRAAILFLATWNTQVEQGIVTGKIYEYMLAHKPILAVCSGDLPNSKMKEMIQQGRLGFCYEEPTATADGPALKAWLRDMYTSWKENGSLDFSPNEEYVRQFGHDRIAERVDQIISEEMMKA